MKKILSVLLLLLFSIFIYPQRFSLSGYVTDSVSGETLIGALVDVDGKILFGKTTNAYGFYSISLPEGNYVFHFSYLGYKKVSKFICLRANTSLNIVLKDSINSIGEVIITAKNGLDDKVKSSYVSVQRLSAATVNKLPVIFGEKDMLKAVQLLPGVKSGGDGQSGFTVRGGTVDQNLILLDDATVYNATHMMGFFSTFNSDAIKDLCLYKGTAPAQFGGRVSSVVDIKTNDGDNQKYRINGGIGLISSKLSVEGPISKQSSSFLFSGRRTYADFFLRTDDRYKNNQLYFYDFNGKVNLKLSENDRVFISAYWGRDVLGLKNQFGIDWGNITATLRWNHLYNSELFCNTSLIYSDYNYQIDIQNNSSKFSIFSEIRDWNFKQEYQYYHHSNHEWKFGLNLIHHSVIPGQITTLGLGVDNKFNKYGLESAIFITDDWKISQNLTLSYGLRIADFAVLGGSDYYVLDKNSQVQDTVNHSSLVKNYFLPEPRLMFSYSFNNKNACKFAYTRNSQHVHLISNSVSGSPTDRWIMNSNNVKPEIADQFTIGYYRNISQRIYELSIEGYLKHMYNQIDYKDNANDQESIVETQLLYGSGRAYGLELLLRKTKGKLTGWFGYTLSRSERLIPGINKNEWYPSRQDRTHDVSIVVMHDLGSKWSMSAIWVYQTGNAVTFPSGKYVINGQTIWYYTERNGYRMPAYHRLDLGATCKLKETSHFSSELSFSVYNAYGRENPYIITFQKVPENSTRTVAKQISLFKWVPSISWNFRIK